MSETNKTSPSQRRRRRRSNQGQASASSKGIKHGQVSKSVAVPKVSAPKKRKSRVPSSDLRVGVGCIVTSGDQILLVRERGRWSLPKGGLEVGELIQDGARRETFEETGLVVELRELAFIVEFRAVEWGHHLQFFYTGREVGGVLSPKDPDQDVQEARFVPIRRLREYIHFRPRLIALETWLRERQVRHFVFNLDEEPAMLRSRRRVGSNRHKRSAETAEKDSNKQQDTNSSRSSIYNGDQTSNAKSATTSISASSNKSERRKTRHRSKNTSANDSGAETTRPNKNHSNKNRSRHANRSRNSASNNRKNPKKTEKSNDYANE